MLKGATCDEKRGTITIDTWNGVEVVGVPRDVYADVVVFIEELRQKKKRQRTTRPERTKRTKIDNTDG